MRIFEDLESRVEATLNETAMALSRMPCRSGGAAYSSRVVVVANSDQDLM